jgi:dynein heavy chain
MNLIFETGDLDQASPATVSRCGMVFMDPGQLGISSVMKSFVEGPLHKHLQNEDQEQLIHDTMNWLIPPSLAAVKTLSRFVDTSEMHQFDVSDTELLTWLSCMYYLTITFYLFF